MEGAKLQLGTRLKTLRKSVQLTQEDVGIQLGISNVMVSKMENNRLDPPPKNIDALCSLYGVSRAEFFQADPGSLRLEGTGNLLEAAKSLLQAAGITLSRVTDSRKVELWAAHAGPPVDEGAAEPRADTSKLHRRE